MQKLIISIWSLLLSGCLGYQAPIEPVTNFDLNRYLGKWYEIARLDHSFERGLEQVSAEYSRREKGGIKVINSRYSPEKNKWREAVGKAFFVRGPDEGYLKVSFFGPFYGSYVIFDLDQENYQYAFIASSNDSYLWFLARTPTVRAELREKFINRVTELNFDPQNLIWVNHKE